MEFRILGPLEVIADGVPLSLGAPRQRELLAYLLLHAGTPVARDPIVEDLWGDARPAQVANVLRVLVSRLRASLKPVEILAAAGGYMLELGEGQRDAHRFERLAGAGSGALRAGDAGAAASKLREGLALRRGPVLADLPHAQFARAERERLEELRLAALETRIDADLALGHHREILAELDDFAAAYASRERFHSQRRGRT